MVIFMEQPFRVGLSGDANKVCCLKKTIYGVKQSPKVWFDKFSSVLRTLSFLAVFLELLVFEIYALPSLTFVFCATSSVRYCHSLCIYC